MSDRTWALKGGPRPNAFIQWKGTNVCMDCYCLCGDQFHVDDDFTYAVQCPHCKRVYEMACHIEMREIDSKTWDGCEIKRGQ